MFMEIIEKFVKSFFCDDEKENEYKKDKKEFNEIIEEILIKFIKKYDAIYSMLQELRAYYGYDIKITQICIYSECGCDSLVGITLINENNFYEINYVINSNELAYELFEFENEFKDYNDFIDYLNFLIKY